jgi:polynucleotide 5'-kinase involved in rRNA processing
MESEDQQEKITIQASHSTLVLGQSGAGKSTFLNMSINILSGVAYEDERKIAITQRLKIQSYDDKNEETLEMLCNIDQFKLLQTDVQGSQALSQTQYPSGYKILDKSTKKQLILIDTPGLSDSKGGIADKNNIENIINSIIAVGGVNAICLVHNATTPRVTTGLRLAVEQIKSMFTEERLRQKHRGRLYKLHRQISEERTRKSEGTRYTSRQYFGLR